jgi:hypothetical protein
MDSCCITQPIQRVAASLNPFRAEPPDASRDGFGRMGRGPGGVAQGYLLWRPRLGLGQEGLGLSELALSSRGRDQGRGLGPSHVTCLRRGPGSGRSGPERARLSHVIMV